MTVTTTVADGIATILLDRPEVRNAVDGPTALALEQAVVAAGGGRGGTFD